MNFKYQIIPKSAELIATIEVLNKDKKLDETLIFTEIQKIKLKVKNTSS